MSACNSGIRGRIWMYDEVPVSPAEMKLKRQEEKGRDFWMKILGWANEISNEKTKRNVTFSAYAAFRNILHFAM